MVAIIFPPPCKCYSIYEIVTTNLHMHVNFVSPKEESSSMHNSCKVNGISFPHGALRLFGFEIFDAGH